jgi:hypothetical protein
MFKNNGFRNSGTTKMGDALKTALLQCNDEGRNPGRIGRRILTNVVKHGGEIGTPAKRKEQPKATAVSADSKGRAWVDGYGNWTEGKRA